MTPAQRHWAERLLGTPMRFSARVMGNAVDYKADRLGVGCVFIIETSRKGIWQYREVHRRWPPDIAPKIARYKPVT